MLKVNGEIYFTFFKEVINNGFDTANLILLRRLIKSYFTKTQNIEPQESIWIFR